MSPARKKLLLADLLGVALRYGTTITLHAADDQSGCHGVVDDVPDDVVLCNEFGARINFNLLEIERIEFHAASGPGTDDRGERERT